MIKAIQTHYKDYFFRSRVEARWAVFFDALGLRWEYEKEGFKLGKDKYYLPDFWLPDLEMWYEIKGEIAWFPKIVNGFKFDHSYELDLIQEFRDAQEWPIACAVGQVNQAKIFFYAWDSTEMGAGCYQDDNAFWCKSNGIVTLNVNVRKEDRVILADNCMGKDLPQFTYPRDYGYEILPIAKAVTKACSARFEHGERWQ